MTSHCRLLPVLTAVCVVSLIGHPHAQLSQDKPPPHAEKSETEGPWVATSHSATYLLNDGYVLNSVAADFDYGNIVPNTALTTTHTYFLTKGSDLMRCGETPLRRNYVQCWQFKPSLIVGYNDMGPLDFLPGAWKSINPKTPATWVFTDSTVTSTELDNKEHDAIFALADKDLSVTVAGTIAVIPFTFETGTRISYRSRYYNGQIVELQKQ